MTVLSSYLRRLPAGEATLRQSLTMPVLLWEKRGEAPEGELLLRTKVLSAEEAMAGDGPMSGEPEAFELKKASHKANAFMMGVTVGRTENNDIVVDDHSVSRFHAYFQQEQKTGQWKLVDAESKNGTCLQGQRLQPNRGEPLRDLQEVRFGDVEMRFMLPGSFIDRLRALAKG